jgi:hypothetical protein
MLGQDSGSGSSVVCDWHGWGDESVQDLFADIIYDRYSPIRRIMGEGEDHVTKGHTRAWKLFHRDLRLR